MGQKHKTATRHTDTEPHYSGYNGATFTPKDSYKYDGGWGRFVMVYKEAPRVVVEIKKTESINWDLYVEIFADKITEMTIKAPYDKMLDIASCLDIAREKAETNGADEWAVNALTMAHDNLSARLNGHSKSNGGRA
ncbi:MAG TPA: hypothetical protein VJ110_00200 [Candidatus Nanoarchaeia archaeon]|nr:hypothetical protein [Candidatus Nanoarchaeia archaeon]